MMAQRRLRDEELIFAVAEQQKQQHQWLTVLKDRSFASEAACKTKTRQEIEVNWKQWEAEQFVLQECFAAYEVRNGASKSDVCCGGVWSGANFCACCGAFCDD